MRHKIAISTFILFLCLFSVSFAQVCSEFRVNTTTEGPQYGPSIAMDAVGNSVVVWQSRTRYPYGVYGQLYDLNGNPVGGEFRVNFYEYSASSEYPSVAMNESGNFVATWTGDGPMGTGVYGRSYDNHGNPLTGMIRLDSSYLVVQQDYASVGIDRNGNFVALWRSRNPDSGWGIYGRRFDNSGNPIGDEFKVSDYATTGWAWATLAMNGNSNFMVSWMNYEGGESGYEIYGKRFNSEGAPIGDTFKVNTYSIDDQIWPFVAIDSIGNFIVTWDSRGQDGDGSGVYAQRFDYNGNPVGAEFRVNSYTPGYQSSPVAAIDGKGAFVITWDSWPGQDGDGYGVFAQRFDKDGNPVGIEFQVNCYLYGNQHVPMVAMDKSGSFTIVWADGGQDGSDYGIYGRRFPAQQQVVIDVKPGSFPNSINLGSKGLTPVAVLTTDNFDVATIDIHTVVFAGVSPVKSTREDVNGDNKLDSVFFFKTDELNLSANSSEATLIGNTTSGISIIGTDYVKIVPATH